MNFFQEGAAEEEEVVDLDSKEVAGSSEETDTERAQMKKINNLIFYYE